MLIIYDETGFIEHAIMVGDFDKLKPLYAAQGKTFIETDLVENLSRLYVKDGEAVQRPDLQITGEMRPVAADGLDTLHFGVAPASYCLTVKMNDVIVHQENSDAGALEFSTTHPGSYELTFEAAFPYYPTVLTIEAT